MTSNDNPRYVTVEMFNDSMTRIERRFDAIDRKFEKIDQTLNELTKEIHAVDRRAEINNVKIDELHYFMGIGFAIMAVVVTFVGFVITLAPTFREMYRDAKKAKSETPMTRSDVQSMIDETISRALGAKNQ